MSVLLPSVCYLRCIALLTLSVSICANTGCRFWRLDRANESVGIAGTDVLPLANPITVPPLDPWLVMDEVSDEVDDYFRIHREERIRVLNNVMTEGWIETHPKIGSTILEPWHHDSTRGFERAHASLQTVRRFAKVRVIPTGDSYQIDVKVFKELEDNPRPTNSTVTGKILRTDSSLDVDAEVPWAPRQNDQWIPQGRDLSVGAADSAKHQSTTDGTGHRISRPSRIHRALSALPSGIFPIYRLQI